MDDVLDRFFERFEFSFRREFSHFVITNLQVKGSFYVLVKKLRGKILGDNLKNLYLFDEVKYISERIYYKFTDNCKEFLHNYFPYFKLVRCYGNYQYNFLVVRKDSEE